MTTVSYAWPRIIQGGMGIGVSSWQLARAVAALGQLGVVSGTALDSVLIRRLQDGDPGGHSRRAMAHFPIPGVAEDVLRRYFRPGGRPPGTPYRLLSMYRKTVSAVRERVTILASFVEVSLAKEGHRNAVGINLLTKVQMPNLASLYGAMLAGVDYVLMGAGIPRDIPGALDALAEHRPARMRFDVAGDAPSAAEELAFSPARHWHAPQPVLERPRFVPIVSAATLAESLVRKATGRIDGFVVEGPTAGGHNAPPRGPLQLTPRGEPVYGARDVADLARMRKIGLPFWLAGGMGSPEAVDAALGAGAAGIQVGTLFAYCAESGLDAALKRHVLEAVARGAASVFTDSRASPTGFPFKVVTTPELVDRARDRQRVCDLGYLRVPVRHASGRVVYRCAAEPVDDYVAKGGAAADTEGRRCLCNGLMANIGHAQARPAAGTEEPPLVTSGDDLRSVSRFLATDHPYRAADVLAYLLGDTPEPHDAGRAPTG